MTVATDIPSTAIVVTDKCYVRPYKLTDVPACQVLADDPWIARYMRDRFPSPYTLADSERWINTCMSDDPTVSFAVIALDGTLMGGIGVQLHEDVESCTFEVGYWLGRPFWGKGVMTSTLKEFSKWAFGAFPKLLRLEALIFSPNVASMRVCERAGYVKEGVRRSAVCKKGIVMDVHIYSLIRTDIEGE